MKMKGGLSMSKKTYTTIQGDMWDKIAYEQMGSVLYTDKLVKANIRHAAIIRSEEHTSELQSRE